MRGLLTCLAACCLLLTGCAEPSPELRLNYAPARDLTIGVPISGLEDLLLVVDGATPVIVKAEVTVVGRREAQPVPLRRVNANLRDYEWSSTPQGFDSHARGETLQLNLHDARRLGPLVQLRITLKRQSGTLTEMRQIKTFVFPVKERGSATAAG